MKSARFRASMALIGAFWLSAFSACGGESDVEGRPISEWIGQLRSENRGEQVRAARVLAGAPKELHGKVVVDLLPVLRSPRENDKFVAAQVLGEYGAVARPAIPDLLPMLEGTEYERNRAAAAKALGQILRDAQPDDEVEKVTQALVKVFRDRYSDVRREAVTACGTIGPAAKACIPHLPRIFEDSKHYAYIGGPSSGQEAYMVMSSGLWAAGRMGPLAAVHMDRLISILNSDRDITTTVVWAIGEIGATQENVVPQVLARLEKAVFGDHLRGFRVRASSHAIGHIKGTGDEYVDALFEALAKFGAKSKSALPLMIACISEGDWHSGRRIGAAIGACKVIRVLGPSAEEALPALEKVVEKKRFDGRIPMKTVEELKKEAQAARTAVRSR